MNNYWIVVCVAIVFIIIAYCIGFECGYDHALNDIIKTLDKELARYSDVIRKSDLKEAGEDCSTKSGRRIDGDQ